MNSSRVRTSQRAQRHGGHPPRGSGQAPGENRDHDPLTHHMNRRKINVFSVASYSSLLKRPSRDPVLRRISRRRVLHMWKPKTPFPIWALFVFMLPAQALAKDYLTITSEPPGAKVEIDGSIVGTTPYRVEIPQTIPPRQRQRVRTEAPARTTIASQAAPRWISAQRSRSGTRPIQMDCVERHLSRGLLSPQSRDLQFHARKGGDYVHRNRFSQPSRVRPSKIVRESSD